MDLGVMTMKGYTTLFRVSELGSYRRMYFTIISTIASPLVFVGGLSPQSKMQLANPADMLILFSDICLYKEKMFFFNTNLYVAFDSFRWMWLFPAFSLFFWLLTFSSLSFLFFFRLIWKDFSQIMALRPQLSDTIDVAISRTNQYLIILVIY